MSTRFVRVLGVGLGVAACHKTPEPPTHNPPAPDPAPVEVLPPANPPAPDTVPLPTWDAVRSGHPEGATNPPSPVLVVARSTGACYKDWRGGMMRPPPDILAAGGRVVPTPAEATGTQVVCPEGEPARLIAAWDALPPGDKTGE